MWNQVNTNIIKFRTLRDSYHNIQLQCCSTVNIFNIHYIDQLAHWIAEQNFDFVYWNIMHDAWYFSIASLPNPVKQELNILLTDKSIPSQYSAEFNRIAEFMNRGASTDGFMTKMKIRDLDNRRNQDFAVIAPEMAKLIGYSRHA